MQKTIGIIVLLTLCLFCLSVGPGYSADKPAAKEQAKVEQPAPTPEQQAIAAQFATLTTQIATYQAIIEEIQGKIAVCQGKQEGLKQQFQAAGKKNKK